MTRQEIIQVLETIKAPQSEASVMAEGLVKNIQVFDKEVDIDLLLKTPALHIKKNLEVAIMKAIHASIDPKIKVRVHTRVEAPPQEQQIRGEALPGVKNIIAVASGKGGVGKSTITANLAVSLAKMGFKVGLLDADIYGPSMPIMFDVAYEKPRTIQVDGVNKMQPIESYGVKLLSIGFFAQSNQAVVWRGPMASKALNQLIRDAHWGELDFMLLDLPPGTGDIHLSIVQALPVTGAVIVSTPQQIALADARKGVAMFRMDSIKIPVLGIVENMAYFTPEELPENKYYIFGKEGARELAEDLDTPFLGEIPLVQSIREAADVGRPAALQEGAPLADAFEALTRRTVEELVKRNENLAPTEVVQITTMAGCSAVNQE